MVFEYMLHGDLAELLRKTDPSIRGSEPAVPLRKVNIKLPVSIGKLCGPFFSLLTSFHLITNECNVVFI